DENFSERVCAEILEISKELRGRSMLLAMAVSMESQESNFGEATRDVVFRALSSWILIRGNRYQVLEEEFYEFALAVHDAALRKIYGVGASDIARGIQALADSIRHGHAQALDALEGAMSAAEEFLSEHPDDSEVGERWRRERPAEACAATEAVSDLIQGGICCVSRHTSLPSALLQDLAYERGEDEEFFAPGPFRGTPLRTLPARKKPLIKIGNDYYLTDPSFARDAAYRAILWNLLRRAPDYKEEFKSLQKEMS